VVGGLLIITIGNGLNILQIATFYQRADFLREKREVIGER
jgi:hypothetical protein